jgi:copper chaperone CopZ
MYKINYNVIGLINNPTKTQIINELKELDGISHVSVDLVRSLVAVEYNEPANKDDIRDCIEHVGCKVK